jgi:hypothetical protein
VTDPGGTVISFTVRVELHGADEEDYASLHEAMEKQGFVRWVKGKNGKKRLPTAEYNMLDVDLDCDEVLDRAKKAANSVKPNPMPWIVVTQSAYRMWWGLKPWNE